MGDYPCYRYSAARRRLTPERLDPPLEPRWSKRGLAYDPVIVESQVFMSLRTGEITACERAAGLEQWRVRLADAFAPTDPREGALVHHAGRLLARVGSTLFVLDPASGHIVAQQPIPPMDLWGSVLLDGVLLGEFHGTERFCAAYELASATIRWQQPWRGVTWAGAGSGHVGVLLADARSTLAGLDVRSGTRLWEQSFATLGRFKDITGPPKGGWPAGQFACWNDLLVVPVAGHLVVGMEMRSGAMRWRTPVRCRVPSSAVLDPSGSLFVFDLGAFYEIDPDTGEIRRELESRPTFREHGLSTFTQVDVTERFLYASDVDGTLFALDKTDASIAWMYRLRDSVSTAQAPVVIDGLLYQMTLAGELTVFAPGH